MSLLLGTIARGVPLPGDTFDVDTSRKDDVGDLNTLHEKEVRMLQTSTILMNQSCCLESLGQQCTS